MPVFVFLFVIAFSYYIYYKIKYIRSKHLVERKYISAKSSVALGFFIAFFGVNQIFIYMSVIGLIIGIIFIFLGGINIWGGYKQYRYYLPQIISEVEH